VAFGDLTESREFDLKPWLLAIGLLIAFVDLGIALGLRGLFRPGPAAGTAVALALMVGPWPTGTAKAQAQVSDRFALEATLETRLAFVETGIDDVDAMSYAGLMGLSAILRRRTSVEPAAPIGVDIEQDEISFFPLLYWPVVPEQAALTEAAIERVDQFMKTGGTILFDTRDQDGGGAIGFASPGPGTERLRRLLARLDVPPLTPVPQDHVLTKAFYLMQTFPGRWTGGRLWVERSAGSANDGVTPLLIGGNDWAAAWAMDAEGRPLAAVVPDGNRQREMAFRFGVNLVMYVLTGNYKADQVHVPAILERLGQ